MVHWHSLISRGLLGVWIVTAPQWHVAFTDSIEAEGVAIAYEDVGETVVGLWSASL